jgi:glycosyltransferase involved in cell wall biosynthesis
MDAATDSAALAGTRVAIVCGHFTPDVGYQEVDLARAFSRQGARVRVVTSTSLSPNARTIVAQEYSPGLVHHHDYDVIRLSPRLTIGPNVLGCNVLPAIREFAPTHVILVGPGKLFGLELFSSDRPSWRKIAIIQDNSESACTRERGAWRGRPRELVHRLVKRPTYRRVVRNADRIVLNVPETRHIIQPWLRSRERELLARKGLDLRLGFDPERFFLDLDRRREWRERHAVTESELLLATCTRATPAKRLQDMISSVSELRAQGLAVRYVLAGLLDNPYGQWLRQHASEQPEPAAFLLLPVLRHDEMRAMFSACDLGFWPRAAITIQQAMGTGLPVVLRSRPSVIHLVVSGQNGWYVQPHETVEEVLATAIGSLSALTLEERVARREAAANFNRAYLSYDQIALEMVNGL